MQELKKTRQKFGGMEYSSYFCSRKLNVSLKNSTLMKNKMQKVVRNYQILPKIFGGCSLID